MEIVTKEETRTPATKMAMATSGSDLKVPSIAIPADDRGELDKQSVSTVKKRQKPGRKLNGIVKGDTRSMYISPTGISTLDIRTRLRISEAELAIVQREVADLLVEKDMLETNARMYEESWKFALQECGRIVEQRDEIQRKLRSLENAVSAAYHPENHKDSKKKKVTKADLEQCKVALETQTRVAETLEHERDQAYDDYQFAQAQLHTLMHQYQLLANTCSEITREREKARAEVAILREELHRYEPETEPQGIPLSRSSSGTPRTSQEENENGPSPDLPLEEQVKELKEERENLKKLYEMVLKRSEQYQMQLLRAEEERKQALVTSESLAALWQKKFEKAQSEQHELNQELHSAKNRIDLLSGQLAKARLHGGVPRHSPSEGELVKRLEQSHTSPTSSKGKFLPPHRTASFHGSLSHSVTAPNMYSSSTTSLTKKPSRSSGSLNKVFSRDRHTHSSSTSQSSTHELMSLVSDNSVMSHLHKQNWGMEIQEYGTGSSQSTEDEASWI